MVKNGLKIFWRSQKELSLRFFFYRVHDELHIFGMDSKTILHVTSGSWYLGSWGLSGKKKLRTFTIIYFNLEKCLVLTWYSYQTFSFIRWGSIEIIMLYSLIVDSVQKWQHETDFDVIKWEIKYNTITGLFE